MASVFASDAFSIFCWAGGVLEILLFATLGGPLGTLDTTNWEIPTATRDVRMLREMAVRLLSATLAFVVDLLLAVAFFVLYTTGTSGHMWSG